MDPKVDVLRRLCRGSGVMNETQFHEAAQVFGAEDLELFNEALLFAVELIRDHKVRAAFDSALNLDNKVSTLTDRRMYLWGVQAAGRSLRTIIRHEQAAAEQVAYSLTVILQHERFQP